MNEKAALLAVTEGEREKRKNTELMLRINSAIILATVSLFMAYTGPAVFAVLIAFFVTLMAWEWGRLVRGKGIDEAFALQAAATALALGFAAAGETGPAILLVIVATAGVFALRRLSDDSRRAWWSAAGVYYAGLPGVALVWLRTDPVYGWHAILFLFLVVWTTDSAAYIFGRLIGGPKLAPRISPKKTWAGFCGAIASAFAAGLLFALVMGGTSALSLGLLAAALAMIAQLGDLAESSMKRIFGLKNSSGLIPGHGGVLDRMDGLVGAAIASALLAWAVDASRPGAALLVWL